MAVFVDPSNKQRVGLSVDETAARLGVSTRHVRRMIHTGRLAHFKFGARLIIPVAIVERMVADAMAQHNGVTERETVDA
jgi:excisionase family DNA binding protein